MELAVHPLRMVLVVRLPNPSAGMRVGTERKVRNVVARKTEQQWMQRMQLLLEYPYTFYSLERGGASESFLGIERWIILSPNVGRAAA